MTSHFANSASLVRKLPRNRNGLTDMNENLIETVVAKHCAEVVVRRGDDRSLIIHGGRLGDHLNGVLKVFHARTELPYLVFSRRCIHAE